MKASAVLNDKDVWAIAAAQQQHFFSFQLVLPNGRAEEKKFVEGSAARPVSRMNGVNEAWRGAAVQLNSFSSIKSIAGPLPPQLIDEEKRAAQFMKWNWLICLLVELLARLWAVAGHGAPRKEANEDKKSTNETNEWSRKHWFVNGAKNGTTSKLSFNNQFIDWGREVRQWSEWAEWRGEER